MHSYLQRVIEELYWEIEALENRSLSFADVVVETEEARRYLEKAEQFAKAGDGEETAYAFLGHWLFQIGDIYIIPAVLGAIAAIFLTVLAWKALAKVYGGRLVP